MSARHVCKWCLAAALAAVGAGFGVDKAIAGERGRTDVEEGVQVLTRGPVHEAFAETVLFDPEPGIVVLKAPPAAIEELPPDQRPEGANVAWIPGYWAWDDERSDFLWVSGVWRALPPGRQWVPGYWGRSREGFQWTSGYWADAQASDVEYLPEPPATIEAGPNIAAPSADTMWLPGCWVWHQNRYAWRPGFWAAAEPEWDWVPARYVWAPRGYVFVEGYWDYPVVRRGVLFAPVYFGAGVYARRGFSYSPTTVIDLGVFTQHLFVRPRYQHYYFGDYYAANYRTAGFHPSYSYASGRYGYDPIYARERWQNRQDAQWEHRVAADFQNRRDHEDARPPRTWAAQRALGMSEASGGRVVAAPLEQWTRSKASPLRFQPVDQSERQKLGQHGQEVQRFRQQRQEMETNAAVRPAEKPSSQYVPAKVKLPKSPVVARPAAELGTGHAPPKTYETPKPDPRIEPKPRPASGKPEPPKGKPQDKPKGKSKGKSKN